MFLIVVAPVCTLGVMVGTDWGRGRIRQLVVQAAHDELGLRLRVDSMQVQVRGLVPPDVVVSANGVAVDDPTYGPFVRADALRIRPSLWALVRGRVDLRSITIDRPVVHLIVRDGQLRNLPRIKQSGAPGKVKLPFRELAIHDARIELDARPYASAELRKVDLDLQVERDSRMSLRIEGGPGFVDHVKGHEPLQRVFASGTVDLDRGTHIDRAVLRTPWVHVEVHDADVPLPDIRGFHGEVAVDLDLAHVPHLPIAFDTPLSGHLHAEGEVADRPEGLTGKAHVQLDHAKLAGWGFGDRVLIDASFDPTAIHIKRAQFHVIRGGGIVTVRGELGLGKGLPLDVHLGIDGLEFDRLMDQLGVSKRAIVSWHFDGNAALHGTLDPLHLDGPIRVDTRDFLVSSGPWDKLPRSKIIGVPRAAVRGRVSVTDKALSFLDLVGDTPHSRLLCDVRLDFADSNFLVKGSSAKLDLADIGDIAGISVAGKGPAQVVVDGTYSDPHVTGHLKLADFTFHGYTFGDVESDARMVKDANGVLFPSVAVTKHDSRYHVDDLLLDFSGGRFESTAKVRVDRLTLADLYDTFGMTGDERVEPYQGSLRGLVDVRYTLDFPGDGPSGTMRLGMNLDAPHLDLDDYAFTDAKLGATWTWMNIDDGLDGGKLALDHLEMHKGGGTVTVTGTMGLGGALDMTAMADNIELRDTEGVGDDLPELGGSWGAVAQVRGTSSLPRADIDLHLTGLTWKGTLLGDARTYVRLTDTQDPWVAAERGFDPRAQPADAPPCAFARAGLAQANWPADPPLHTVAGPEPALDRPMAYLVCGEGLGGKLRFDLAIGRTEEIPVRGIIDVHDLPLAPFVPKEAKDQLKGAVSGRLAIYDGEAKLPQTLVGRLVLSKLHLLAKSSGVALDNHGAIDVSVDQGRFHVAQAELLGPRSELRLQGGGSVQHGLALQVSGGVDLSLLSTLSPRVTKATGRVTVQMNLTGAFSDPSVFGEAHVEDASFLFASFSEPLQELAGNVTFSAHRVLFEDFAARLAGGRVHLNGAATLQDGSLDRYHFNIQAEDLTIRPEDGIEIGAGGNLRLTWARGERLPTLHGTVRLDRVMYTRPINLTPTLGELYKPHRVEVQRYDPAADQLAFDVRVVDEGPLRIENNLVDAEIGIEDSERPFRIVGTDQRFGVLGTLELRRGTLRFRNTQFDVHRGVIDFDDPFRIDPHFDLLAVTEIHRVGDLTAPDWRITLHAHGSRDAFQLDASSEPPLSEEDVLMLLTVGMTRSEVEQLQAGDLASGTALEALTTVTGVDREVQKRLKVIDDFRITSTYSERTSRTEPEVSIGKRISDRVRLSASTGLSSESKEVRTAIQWQLGDQTSVEASYDNLNTTTTSSFGNVGVDVRWRLEFE